MLDTLLRDLLRAVLPRPLVPVAFGALTVVATVDRITGGAIMRRLTKEA